MRDVVMRLWRYRHFIFSTVRREFESRYRSSLLGGLWTVIHPLAMILVYTLVFSQVMRSRLPGVAHDFGYSIFLCAGLLSWGLFAEIISRGCGIFLEHANLIKKIQFPRLCLPIVVILTALINFGIIFGLFTLFLIVSGHFPGVVYIAVVPLVALLIAFGIGLAIFLAVINVFFRDVGQLTGVLLTFWFWLTPIVYPADILPTVVRHALWLNPLAGWMMTMQNVILHARWPQWIDLMPITVAAGLFVTLGWVVYRRHAAELSDEL